MDKGPNVVRLPIINQRMDLKWVSLFTMVFQNTLLVLLMRYSRVGSENLYLTSTAVVMSEFFKMIISLIGMYQEMESIKSNGYFNYIQDEIMHFDTIKLAVPGLLYTVQNNLLFIALSNLDAAVYQVTYQLKILTTALFSVIMLGKRLTALQTFSLLLLFCGVSLVQLGQMPDKDDVSSTDEHHNAFLGLICVLLACCSSGFAGVYFEKILKSGRKVSLFVRNLQLSIFGVFLGLILVLFNDGDKVLRDGFFQNYTRTTWSVIFVQAGSGFVIASVMKYADNILKGFATAVSIILSAWLSIFIFDFTISVKFFFGALLVVFSVFLYGYRPPNPKKDSIVDGASIGRGKAP